MMRFSKINTLKPFDWMLIAGVVITSVAHSALVGSIDFPGSVAAVSGVLCVVLVARGNIFNYLFGLINVTLYAWISFRAGLYGDAALNALYYLPMQFVGWFLWLRRREDKSSVTVPAKRMSLKGRILLSAASLVLVVGAGYILMYAGDPQPFKDSATTVLSVIAMFLMVRTYMEQWPLWTVVNIISVVMWIIAYLRGEAHSLLMVAMWVFYLINSLKGWYLWHLSALGQTRR
jgi:nicotinamide mononucleotide transporter